MALRRPDSACFLRSSFRLGGGGGMPLLIVMLVVRVRMPRRCAGEDRLRHHRRVNVLRMLPGRAARDQTFSALQSLEQALLRPR